MAIFIRATDAAENRGDYYITLAKTGPVDFPWVCTINDGGWNGSLITDLGTFDTQVNAILAANQVIAALRGLT